MGTMRLDKYLSDMQAGTRSEVKEYIRKGRIQVDGQVVQKPETKISDGQLVTLDCVPINYVQSEYYMLNKPQGVLTATKDGRERTVLDLIDCARKDLFPVGRLDKDTEGLLLITNDGALAHRLLSPDQHVDKVYYAVVEGIITDAHVKAFLQGLRVDDTFTAMPAKLEILGTMCSQSKVLVTLREGKYHQIKRMFAAIGSRVLYLKRISMGGLMLDETLQQGEYRPLTAQEIELLKTNC